ncbi:MAG: hypothetical protein ACLFQ5_08850, partial [Oceanicaulis sp.]
RMDWTAPALVDPGSIERFQAADGAGDRWESADRRIFSTRTDFIPVARIVLENAGCEIIAAAPAGGYAPGGTAPQPGATPLNGEQTLARCGELEVISHDVKLGDTQQSYLPQRAQNLLFDYGVGNGLHETDGRLHRSDYAWQAAGDRSIQVSVLYTREIFDSLDPASDRPPGERLIDAMAARAAQTDR